MKFQRMLKIQMAMAGLAAALLMPGSIRAQQEMDPTTFDVNPAVPQGDGLAVAQVPQEAVPAAATEEDASVPAGMTENAQIRTTGDTLVILALMACAGMLAIRGIAERGRVS